MFDIPIWSSMAYSPITIQGHMDRSIDIEPIKDRIWT